MGPTVAAAVVSVLAYRLVSFWIPAAAGLPLEAYLQRTTVAPPDR